jgi:hypothetical protein
LTFHTSVIALQNTLLVTANPAAARAVLQAGGGGASGVGAILRQWMPENFASVIDLLIEKNQVNVVLLGGRDEAELRSGC